MSLSVCHDSVKYVTHCPFPRLLADRVHNLTAIILDTEFAEYHGPPVTLCLFHICPQRGTHREAQISAKKVNKLAKQRRRWENTPACQEKSTLLAQSLSLLNMRVCNCGPELLKNITTEGSDSVPSNQVSFQHFKINSTQRKVFCPHTFWLIHELVFACLPWHWFTFRFGAFFFFFLFWPIRPDATSEQRAPLLVLQITREKGNGCFFDGSKIPQLEEEKKKINPVCTVCWQFQLVGLRPFFWKHLQLPHLKPTTAASRTSWYFVLPVIVLARGINGENWTGIPPPDICFLPLCSLNQNTTRSWSWELLCKCIKVGFINRQFILEEISTEKKNPQFIKLHIYLRYLVQ